MGRRGYQQMTRFVRRGASEGRGEAIEGRGGPPAVARATTSSIAAPFGGAASAVGPSMCL